MKEKFSFEEAEAIGNELGITWVNFDIEQFRIGLDVELEHGNRDPQTNITNDDSMQTGKIVLTHLKEFPDYYTRLDAMEREASEYWKNKALNQ